MADAVGVVYNPPRAGFPYLAAVFMNGDLLHCETVATLAEGEALLAATMHEMSKIEERAPEAEEVGCQPDLKTQRSTT